MLQELSKCFQTWSGSVAQCIMGQVHSFRLSGDLDSLSSLSSEPGWKRSEVIAQFLPRQLMAYVNFTVSLSLVLIVCLFLFQCFLHAFWWHVVNPPLFNISLACSCSGVWYCSIIRKRRIHYLCALEFRIDIQVGLSMCVRLWWSIFWFEHFILNLV